MAYASQADFVERFGVSQAQQLTDIWSPRLGAVNDAVLQTYLADASAEIDVHLAGRMSLPLVSPPAMLKVYCLDITRYRLMFGQPDARAVEAYKAAIAFLGKIASGVILLQAPADVPVPSGMGEVAFVTGYKSFGREQYAGPDDDHPHGFW
jgi:phage gp36-like protein